MRSGEYKYLIDMKLHNGLCLKTAKKEISELQNSQTLFKNLTRELRKKDTVIRNLEKEINGLRYKLDEQKNKAIRENLKIIAQADPKTKELNIHEVKRILRIMRLRNIPMTRKQIEKECNLNKNSEEVMKFLCKEKLIKFDNKKYEIC